MEDEKERMLNEFGGTDFEIRETEYRVMVELLFTLRAIQKTLLKQRKVIRNGRTIC
jgi:hypothetical protein